MEKHPLKVFIRDIFSFVRDADNKYIHHFRGHTFKNVELQGVVTAADSRHVNPALISFQLTDATGSIKVVYHTKFRYTVTPESMSKLKEDVRSESGTLRCQMKHDQAEMLEWLQAQVILGLEPVVPKRGDHVSVVGDIFEDSTTGKRCVSAFHCQTTCIERDLMWMRELHYLYENYYKSQASGGTKAQVADT